MEFASTLIGNIGQLYSAGDEHAFNRAKSTIVTRLQTLETSVGGGPWFGGTDFSLVDAALAPAFRYFDVIVPVVGIDFFDEMPKVIAWRRALTGRRSVRQSVSVDYEHRLLRFSSNRDSVIGRLASSTIELNRQAVAWRRWCLRCTTKAETCRQQENGALRPRFPFPSRRSGRRRAPRRPRVGDHRAIMPQRGDVREGMHEDLRIVSAGHWKFSRRASRSSRRRQSAWSLAYRLAPRWPVVVTCSVRSAA